MFSVLNTTRLPKKGEEKKKGKEEKGAALLTELKKKNYESKRVKTQIPVGLPSLSPLLRKEKLEFLSTPRRKKHKKKNIKEIKSKKL
jgi:hypothetical protein